MNELRTTLPTRHPPRKGRRIGSTLSWLTVALLALNGWVYYSSNGSTAISTPDDRSPESLAESPHGESQLTPIENEFDQEPNGRVMTASATSVGSVPDGERGETGIESSADESGTKYSDERCRQTILGEWYDEYRGKRHLTIREDGKGTMAVEPDGIGKRLFAAQLTFDIEWTVADGHVTMKMLGGEPKAKVQLILKLHGQEAKFKVLQMTDGQMLLLDADGTTRYDWRRTASKADSTN